jgi:WD40 repeat protein
MDMIKVFVSYRRDDSRHQAGRLYDHLVEQFGKGFVFKDVDSIPLGADFREILTERVAGCDVFLAVIGDGWLSAAGPDGTSRLTDPGDFVRIEIEAALGRSIPVIPVLVGNSSVPKAEELPESLRRLAFRNASFVRPNPDFHHDVERLIHGIKEAVSGSPQPALPRVGLVAAAALTAVLGVLLLGVVYVAANKGRNKIKVDELKGAASKEPVRSDVTSGGTGGLPTGPARTPVGETPGAPASAPSLEKDRALSPVIGAINTKGAFQPLFNGKDLTGWKAHSKQVGNWHVSNGVLIGSGPSLSHLYSERDDFTDFHLRIEARFNEVGSSGVYVRCPFGPNLPSDDPKWPDGFEATINNAQIVRHNTGGLYPGVANDVFLADFGKVTSVPFGQWFTLEVIAEGYALAVLVNGKSSAYKFAPNRLHPAGHIALQQYSPETVIEFRKVEINELNRSNQNDSKEIGRFLGTADRVVRVDFTPDGLGILSGETAVEFMRRTGGGNFYHFGHAYPLRLWTVASGRNEFTMRGAGAFVKALALSSDGRYAASSDGPLHERPILIWDLKTGKRMHTFLRKSSDKRLPCTALSFSPDDRRVIAALANGSVLVWDLTTDEEQPAITFKSGPFKLHEFPGAAFSSDRKHLITGRQTGLVELWDLQSGQRLQTFAGHAGEVGSVACSPDGRLILSAGSDNTVRLWDVATGKELKQLRSEDREVRCIAFSPESRRALSAGVDGPVHLWDLASGKEVCRMEGHTMRVNSIAFAPDGRRAVSGSDDRSVRLWQLPELGVAGGRPSTTFEASIRKPVMAP